MPKITLNTSYNRDTTLLISVEEFKQKYLFGIDLSRYGVAMQDDVYEVSLRSAQARLEEHLQLKFIKQIYWEQKHFWHEDWINWGYIPTQFPVVCPIEVTGWLGTVRQTLYPREWLSAKKTSDGQYLHRMLYLVPNVNSTYNQIIVFQGILPNVNYMKNRQIPNYWNVVYTTGFDIGKVPATILQAVGKIAAIDILTAAQDGMLQYPGVASTSISLDGLSQNLSTIANSQSGIFGPRITQYSNDLFGKDGKSGEIARLKDTYNSFVFGVA